MGLFTLSKKNNTKNSLIAMIAGNYKHIDNSFGDTALIPGFNFKLIKLLNQSTIFFIFSFSHTRFFSDTTCQHRESFNAN